MRKKYLKIISTVFFPKITGNPVGVLGPGWAQNGVEEGGEIGKNNLKHIIFNIFFDIMGWTSCLAQAPLPYMTPPWPQQGGDISKKQSSARTFQYFFRY